MKKTVLEKSVMAVLLLLPLLVFRRLVPLAMAEKYMYNHFGYVNIDFYNKIKSEYLIGLATLIVCLIVILLVQKKIMVKFRWQQMFPAFYGLLVCLSFLFARYKGLFIAFNEPIIGKQQSEALVEGTNIGLIGHKNLYEGVWVLLAYVVLFSAAWMAVDQLQTLDKFIMAVVISGALVSLIAVSQYFGFNLLASDLGKRLILGRDYLTAKDTMAFAFDKYYSASTLMNPNYLGGYLAFVMPLSFAKCLSVDNRRQQVVLTSLTLLIFAGLLSSKSSAGFIAVTVSMFLMALLQLRNIKRYLRKYAVMVVFMIGVIAAMNISSSGAMTEELFSLTDDVEMIEGVFDGQSFHVETIEYIPGGLTIKSNVSDLSAIIEDGELKFLDENLNELGLVKEDEAFRFNSKSYDDYSLERSGGKDIMIKLGEMEIWLIVDKNRVWLANNSGEVKTIVKEVPSVGFEGRGSFASFRGYIWSRSLPLLRHTVILGTGPDTFGILFPHYDVLGKINILGSAMKIASKPHNMYLQIGVNTGILSLVMVVTTFGMGLFYLLIMYFGQNVSMDRTLFLGLACAMISFAVSSLANDSIMALTATVWTLSGASYGYYLKSYRPLQVSKGLKKIKND